MVLGPWQANAIARLVKVHYIQLWQILQYHVDLAKVKENLATHGGQTNRILDASRDMPPAFVAGIETTFPMAIISFDKCHAVKVFDAKSDEVRRQEQKERPELIKIRRVWLNNEETRKKIFRA